MNFFRLVWFSSLPAALLLCGCGPEAARSRIVGEVTFQGKPLDQGAIQFAPAEGQETFSGGEIKDGRYVLPAEFGLAPGKYEVRINSSLGTAPADPLETGATGVFTERIPAKFNSQTTLTAEVKGTGENKFDFQIP